MGYIVHEAIVVTISGYPRASKMGDVEAFRNSLPDEWKPLIIGPVKSVMNNYYSYVFLPDGSKQGWDTSKQGDNYRKQFAALFAGSYEDGSPFFDCVQISFGADERDTPRITRTE